MKKGLCMNRLICLFGFMCVLVLAGCAAQDIPKEGVGSRGYSGDAEVVFVRPSLFSGTTDTMVLATVDGDIQPLALVPPKTKTRVYLAPGRHVFILGNAASNVLEAELERDKTYYVLIKPLRGMWKEEFGLEPVPYETATSGLFAATFAGLPWQERNYDTVQSWFEEHRGAMLDYSGSVLQRGRTDDMAVLPEDGLTEPLL